MTPPDPAKLLADCCAAGPIDLIIERIEDGTVVAQGSLDQPFALIGRDPYCDVHLNEPEVALRHAFAQVIGGHVFVVDLACPLGIHWPEGRQGSGWLNPGEPLRIGPFHLFLTRPAAAHPTVLAAGFNPLMSPIDGASGVVLEFRTGLAARSAWEVNRVLTLVGRASECKLNLAGEDVALFHAYLLKTIAGLWVIDLRARGGVFVNDKKVRVHLLQDGDVLRIGTFEIGIKYPKLKALMNTDSSVSFEVPMSELGPRPDSASLASATARIGPPQPTMIAPEGALPLADETEIAVLTPAPKPQSPMIPVGGLAANLLPMLRQMGEMQDAMHAQFQQSVAMLMQMVEQMHPDELVQVPPMPAESKAMTAVAPRRPEPLPTVPLPDPALLPPITEQTAKHHEDLFDRMTKLNDERQSLWQRFLKR